MQDPTVKEAAKQHTYRQANKQHTDLHPRSYANATQQLQNWPLFDLKDPCFIPNLLMERIDIIPLTIVATLNLKVYVSLYIQGIEVQCPSSKIHPKGSKQPNSTISRHTDNMCGTSRYTACGRHRMSPK
jgi:hypothetical protein